MSEEKREELKEELPKVAVAGSSVRTKPGTDPDEAFDTAESTTDSVDEVESQSRIVRWIYSVFGL